jgi:hypothetical protein
MPISNYPNGFANGVTIRGVPVTVTNPGNVFWVDSGAGSDGNKGTYERPFATIDYAIGRCTASNGDIIFVKPGHTETVSAAGDIAADVAGVAIIGLGKGSLRPTITLDTATAATVTISAANVTMHNLKFVAGFADIVAMLTVTATDAHIDMCEFVESGANLNWVDVIDCSGADNTPQDATMRFFFESVDGSAALYFNVDDNTTDSDSDTVATLVDDTFVTVAAHYDGKGKIELFANDALVTTMTDVDVPGAEMAIGIGYLNGAAGAETTDRAGASAPVFSPLEGSA